MIVQMDVRPKGQHTKYDGRICPPNLYLELVQKYLQLGDIVGPAIPPELIFPPALGLLTA